MLFSYLTCLDTTPFILLNFFSLIETISLKIENLGDNLSRTDFLYFYKTNNGQIYTEETSSSNAACRPWLKNVASLSSLVFSTHLWSTMGSVVEKESIQTCSTVHQPDDMESEAVTNHAGWAMKRARDIINSMEEIILALKTHQWLVMSVK